MRPSIISNTSLKIINKGTLYEFSSLSKISVSQLPNYNNFGNGNYLIQKSNFNHWPIYKKISNSNKVITEIKKIRGDITQFKNDLLKIEPSLEIESVNLNAGIVNIKGDQVTKIKTIFSKYI
ncbi:unnamed protein product [Candida verbasci]|uniref:Large ribosomal subunit protein mL49 n=1 Tax=Candida verbasci TaxID=1227364 RepID=A0A9W4U0P8_9ASCO|nr:unnamed protein product [Candida verbasci]